MIDPLRHLNFVKLSEHIVRVADEMFVNKVDKLVFGRVIKLVVALGLAMSDEVLSIEVVQVNLNLSGHAFPCHGLATVAEEIKVVDATNRLEALHDALTHDITLLRVRQNANSLVQVAIDSAEMSLNCSAQHLYLICNLIIIL